MSHFKQEKLLEAVQSSLFLLFKMDVDNITKQGH